MKKYIIWFAIGCVSASMISVILWILFPSAYFFSLMLPPWQGMPQMERDFQQNQELITLVKNYLAESEYDDISITASMKRDVMFVNIAGHEYAEISNEEAIEAIAQL